MKIKVVGISSHAGALFSGTEVAPRALREGGLIEFLTKEGLDVKDLGDMEIPNFLPRHNVAPIRNWPGPRMVWEAIARAVQGWFDAEEFVLILGGDCSLVTGTIHGLCSLYKEKTYLIAVDGHLDTVKPSSERCVGAAAMGQWFLASENMFFSKPKDFDGKNMTVVGYHQEGEPLEGMSLYSLEYLHQKGIAQTVGQILSALPPNAKILVHLDLDVIHKEELYAVYSPSERGLSLREAKELLRRLLQDPRVVGMEVAEFSGLRDLDGSQAVKLSQLLSEVIEVRK